MVEFIKILDLCVGDSKVQKCSYIFDYSDCFDETDFFLNQKSNKSKPKI